MGQIRCLVESEERLRRGEAVLDEAAERLDPYWLAFLAVLADGGIERLKAVAPDHPLVTHAVRR
jgi:hypothetical protein